jgi:hypothetical protein
MPVTGLNFDNKKIHGFSTNIPHRTIIYYKKLNALSTNIPVSTIKCCTNDTFT